MSGLRELILAAERYRLAAATYLGMSVTDSQAISYLMARGPMGPHELADALELSTGSVTALIDRLHQRGYVERRDHPHDRRRSVVAINDSGAAALVDVRDWMRHVFADLPTSDLPQTAQTIATLTDGLRELVADVPSPGAPSPGTRLRRRSR